MLQPRCARCATWSGWVSVAGNVSLAAVKWTAGIACGSQALTADAMHSSVDVFGSVITLVMLTLSRRKPSSGYPYGFGKLEDISALLIYLILIGAGSVIVVDAVSTLIRGEINAPTSPALLAALLSVAVNAFMFYYISCAGRQTNSPSLLALGYENKVDALSSVAAVVGILGAILGYAPLDPLAAIVVAAFIIVESARELVEASHRLTDRALERPVRERLERCVLGTPFVLGIKSLKTRRMGASAHADVDVFVDRDISVEVARTLSVSIAQRIRSHVDEINSVTVFAHPMDEGVPPRAARLAELVEIVRELGVNRNRSGGKL